MNNMKVSEQLKAAKALITSPTTWIQHDYYKFYSGHDCFCSIGAVHKVLGQPWGISSDCNPLTEFLGEAMGCRWTGVDSFNDSHTHEEVMSAWDEAIRLAEAEESVL